MIREALFDYSEATWKRDEGIYEADEALYGEKWENLKKHIKELLREEEKAKRGRGAKFRKSLSSESIKGMR